jgi:hypothetical protein
VSHQTTSSRAHVRISKTSLLANNLNYNAP